MPSAQFKFLDGAGHACQLEQPWLSISIWSTSCAYVTSSRTRSHRGP